MADNAVPARAMLVWEERVRRNWKSMHIGTPDISEDMGAWVYAVPVYLGERDADDVQLEVYVAMMPGGETPTHALSRGAAMPGAMNGYIYTGRVPASRPADQYTVRVIPHHPGVRVPTELPLILWQK